jgi:hypothetical protein
MHVIKLRTILFLIMNYMTMYNQLRSIDKGSLKYETGTAGSGGEGGGPKSVHT